VSFSYNIGDGTTTIAATATLDITPLNDPPTNSAVTLSAIAEDSGVRLITQAQLLANASDIDGDTLTATGLTLATGSGNLVDNGNGTWNFTPTSNDSTGVSFSYNIGDGTTTIATTASLDITPANDPPTNSPVTLSAIAEDSGIRLITQAQLLANASDIDGDTLTATGLTLATGTGNLVDNGNGTWNFTPTGNDSTGVSFSYSIGDGNSTIAAIATLDITPINDTPTGNIFSLNPITENSSLQLITQAQLLANVSDIDGDILTATDLTLVNGTGNLVDNGNGTWSFTPAANDSSGVSFSYNISDGTVTIAVTASLDIAPATTIPNSNGEIIPTLNVANTDTTPAPLGNGTDTVDTIPQDDNENNDQNPARTPVINSLGDYSLLRSSEAAAALMPTDTELTNPNDTSDRSRYDRILQQQNLAAKTNISLNAKELAANLISPASGFNVIDAEEFSKALKRVRQDMDNVIEEQQQHQAMISGITFSVTTGILIWSLRASSLLLTLFSMLPLWRGIDPLPILEQVEKRKKELEEQRKDKKKEDINAHEVGYLFDRVNAKSQGNKTQ
ncbi:MAG: cadherin-like domain-containing protein, partial [Pseudomonadota bacterium]